MAGLKKFLITCLMIPGIVLFAFSEEKEEKKAQKKENKEEAYYQVKKKEVVVVTATMTTGLIKGLLQHGQCGGKERH